MKKKVNNKMVKTVVPADGEIGAKARAERKLNGISTSDMISAIVERSTTPLITSTTAPVSAPDYGALLSAGNPAVSAPVPSSAPVTSAGITALLNSGNPNLTSRRIRVGTPLTMYRIANNQRKDSWSGGAKYYVQGGTTMVDPESGRERFEVCVEYPYTDLYLAKTKLVALRATLTAPVPSTAEVTRIA